MHYKRTYVLVITMQAVIQRFNVLLALYVLYSCMFFSNTQHMAISECMNHIHMYVYYTLAVKGA